MTCSSHDCASRLAWTTLHEDLPCNSSTQSTEPIPVRNLQEPLVGDALRSQLGTQTCDTLFRFLQQPGLRALFVEDSQLLLQSFDEFQRPNWTPTGSRARNPPPTRVPVPTSALSPERQKRPRPANDVWAGRDGSVAGLLHLHHRDSSVLWNTSPMEGEDPSKSVVRTTGQCRCRADILDSPFCLTLLYLLCHRWHGGLHQSLLKRSLAAFSTELLWSRKHSSFQPRDLGGARAGFLWRQAWMGPIGLTNKMTFSSPTLKHSRDVPNPLTADGSPSRRATVESHGDY